jgi:4-diphosphocytidyl-2-C-methyl-D-erythritol kinase
MEIGAHLGADVPFFLVGGTALGLGRGDELYPLADLPSLRVVLAWPDEGVSTGDAYGWLKAEATRQSSAHSSDGSRCTVQQLMEGDCSGLRNDLERPVMSHRPRIRRLGRELAATGALVTRMTGSGSALFALFQTSQEARRAALAVAGPGRTVTVTRTMGRLAGGYRVV